VAKHYSCDNCGSTFEVGLEAYSKGGMEAVGTSTTLGDYCHRCSENIRLQSWNQVRDDKQEPDT
jgi:hypothetical protein